jgi:hypothetical protein
MPSFLNAKKSKAPFDVRKFFNDFRRAATRPSTGQGLPHVRTLSKTA